MLFPSEWPDPALYPQGGWALSTSHSSSSYGIPVLVSPEGRGYGPGDLLSISQVARLQGVSPQAVTDRIVRGSLPATEVMGRRGIKAQDALMPVPKAGRPAADAVRP